METSLFYCCKNIIFHMNKAEFQILWTIIRLFLWGVPHISQPDGNWWGTPFLRNSSSALQLLKFWIVYCRLLTRSQDFVRRGAQTSPVGLYIYSNIYKYIHSNFAGGGHVPPVTPLATRLGYSCISCCIIVDMTEFNRNHP